MLKEYACTHWAGWGFVSSLGGSLKRYVQQLITHTGQNIRQNGKIKNGQIKYKLNYGIMKSEN